MEFLIYNFESHSIKYAYPSTASTSSGCGSFGLKLGNSDRKNMPNILGSSKFVRPDPEREYASMESDGGKGS